MWNFDEECTKTLLSKVAICTMLILLIYKHGGIFHLLISSIYFDFLFLMMLLIYFTPQSQRSLHPRLPVPPFPPPHSFSLFLRKGEDSHGYHPDLAYHVAVRLDVTSSIKVIEDRPVRRKAFKGS